MTAANLARTIWLASTASSSTNTAASLTVNGNAFFAQGVCYQPIPWGGSANWPPFGDFMTAPWQEVWQRDLPMLRQGGVNLLRTYNMPCEQKGVVNDHGPFLSACWNDGVDPIFVLLGFGDLNNLAAYDPWDDGASLRTKAQAVFVDTVKKYKDHPAVMGFIIANEVNTNDTINNTKFWNWLNNLCILAKAAAPDKLCVMSLVDDSMLSVQAGDSNMPNLDIWGINSYRGQINPANANNFNNLWSSFQAASSKPLLITEWGAPASTHDQNNKLVFSAEVAENLNTYITGHYQDFLWNSVNTTANGGANNPNSNNWAAVCVGSCYFEWSDELWKLDSAYPALSCQATVQNPGVATNTAFPGGWDDEECFGLNAISPVASGGVLPADRPGPNPQACKGGPWDFATNQPYAADQLTPRPSWSTLSGLFALSCQGTIVAAFGAVGNWQATFYLGSEVPAGIVDGMTAIGTGIPAGTTVQIPVNPNGQPLVQMSLVLTNTSGATNPFSVSQNSVEIMFVS